MAELENLKLSSVARDFTCFNKKMFLYASFGAPFSSWNPLTKALNLKGIWRTDENWLQFNHIRSCQGVKSAVNELLRCLVISFNFASRELSQVKIMTFSLKLTIFFTQNSWREDKDTFSENICLSLIFEKHFGECILGDSL